MRSKEVLQLLEMANENEESHVYTEDDWLIQTVSDILENNVISTINLYGRREADQLKEDVASLGTEVMVDVSNHFTSMRTSKIEMYAKTDEQFLDFEITNLVSMIYKDNTIEVINDEKEEDEVNFNEDTEIILLKTDYIYTTDRGLDTKKILDIYIPFSMAEVIEEGADY